MMCRSAIDGIIPIEKKIPVNPNYIARVSPAHSKGYIYIYIYICSVSSAKCPSTWGV